ncbi:MAG: permease [Sulfurovum sp.]|nr:permease [Sulfurovum sp.]
MINKNKNKGKKTQQRTGLIMLIIVIGIYIFSAILNLTATYNALLNSFQVLKVITPILLVVIFLMALLNSLINQKKISKHLGHNSGVKGWFIALVSGVLSHGPGYVWYPMLSELRSHGARDGLIVAFFYARAIKLPWLPMMISYFGLAFTSILTLYILLAALVQGIITDKLLAEKG